MPRPRSRVKFQSVAAASPLRLRPRIPAIDLWTAGEMFVSPHVEERRRGLAILVGTELARASNLTLHLLAARVVDPDLRLRADIVQTLAAYFEKRGLIYRYPADVRAALSNELRQLERPHLLALVELQYASTTQGLVALAPHWWLLIDRIPHAAAHLLRFVTDHGLALPLRCAALELIGLVGFVEAIVPLAGLEARLAGRQAGQLAMRFAPADYAEAEALLPTLRATLQRLRQTD